jgi:hypothetical protein
MATYNKFQDFVEQLGLKVHNLNTDTLKAYLSNEAPLAADTVKADIAEITAEHGYPAGGTDITNVWSQAAGVGTLSGTDVVFTASGGPFGPFRYAIIYNDDNASDRLVCWWDYGSSITINDTETFTLDFAAAIFTIT